MPPGFGRTLRLLGAANALRHAIGSPLPPNRREEYDRQIAAATEALGENAFAVWEEGRSLTWEQAAAFALGEATQ